MNRFNTKGKRTYSISEIQVGDIVKFKGTRNGGIRKILEVYEYRAYKTPFTYVNDKLEDTIDYFCRVLTIRFNGFGEEPYTSTNSVDKLSHVFKDGTWFKVVKD